MKGSDAEKIAASYLQKQSLTLITQNYRCRFGEIDLIMQHGSTAARWFLSKYGYARKRLLAVQQPVLRHLSKPNYYKPRDIIWQKLITNHHVVLMSFYSADPKDKK